MNLISVPVLLVRLGFKQEVLHLDGTTHCPLRKSACGDESATEISPILLPTDNYELVVIEEERRLRGLEESRADLSLLRET